MTLLKHELRQNRISFWIWTASISFLLAICIFLFPQMKSEMEGVNDLFASMGSFTAAFGMDRLNFGEFLGFYGVECGNVLGLGGAFFAALLGISALSKEEKEHTAEFLLAHPVSRVRVVSEKLGAVFAQLLLMNLIILLCSVVSIYFVGESPEWRVLLLLHLAHFLLQVEVSALCFCISAFLRRGGLGIGLGMAALLYFLNIISNISDGVKWLKYLTPFGFTEGADILSDKCLDMGLVALGLGVAVVAVLIAYWQYCRKDIL